MNKDVSVGSIDLLALLKYLWAAFIPIIMKGWQMIDRRMDKTETKVEILDKRVSEMSTDVKVLVERSGHQQEDINEIKELLMKLLMSNKP